jgi:hypothetical protein
MKIVVFTDFTTCSYCKKIKPILYGTQFQTWLGQNRVQLISADRSADPNGYAALKRQWKFSGQYPTVYVVGDNGKQLARFVARSYTAAKLIAKIAPYCPGCSDGGGTAPAAQTKTCPTCKGLGYVSALLLACLTLCGCVMTRAGYKPAEAGKAAELTFYRFAVLYPFEVSGVVFPDGTKIGKYGSDGGAAGVVTVIDAAGNVYNAAKRP